MTHDAVGNPLCNDPFAVHIAQNLVHSDCRIESTTAVALDARVRPATRIVITRL